MKRTWLYDRHKALGAKFFNFYGWEMPLEYSGVVSEHEAVRFAAGVFDVSHMGVIEVGGEQSEEFLGKALSILPEKIAVDTARYALMLNHEGGIVDDLMVYRLTDTRFLLCVNSKSANKDTLWLQDIAKDYDTILVDDSPDTAILAVQGPASWEVVSEVFGIDPASFKYHHFINSEHDGTGYILSKSGYTGERGFEVFVHKKTAVRLWDEILLAGEKHHLLPCGLGARDTLRLEMGYILYGNDADENTSPLEAGLMFAVDEENTDYIGREALAELREKGPARRLVAMELLQRGVPRQGCRIFSGNDDVGVVTSGNFSPVLKKGIALGYIPSGVPVDNLSIVIRDKRHVVKVVEPPFYRKPGR